MSDTDRRLVRCAIYTRKSSDEGLEQEYNSLDAQHDACIAYISSQKSEGWIAIPEQFDDGGFSGGTIQRPALSALLARIDAREIDMVVVYKIDRLTRSLSDFSKLVEGFDHAGCSFVSVTQSFNTSTSTGRLMLNVLLSFAQFEREVTSERIRDKIAASKRKGIWMGGTPPLGYEARDRNLIINEFEAERVRQLFALFKQHRCLTKTWRAANELGIRSRPMDGHPDGPRLRRSGLLWILSNPVYVGQVRHKETTYLGRHEPIIDAESWTEVQSLVAQDVVRRRTKGRLRHRRSWLAGKIFSEAGVPLVPRFGGRPHNKHRYYVSSPRSRSNSIAPNIWRVRADKLERLVSTAIAKHLERVQGGCPISGATLQDASSTELLGLVKGVHLRQGLVEIILESSSLHKYLPQVEATPSKSITHISAPFQIRRANQEACLLLGNHPGTVDRRLLEFVSRAAAWWQTILEGENIIEIARRYQVSARQIRMHLPSAFLAPDIIEAIVDGRQPPSLTVGALRSGKVPMDWAEQRKLFSIGSSPRRSLSI